MLVDFNTLPPQSKIWIYQSDKVFTEAQIADIKTMLEPFIESWKRHGNPLRASYKIIYNQFIVLAVDEFVQEVSGCSIDASVHAIQAIEKAFQVVMTDKLKVAFKEGGTISVLSLSDFRKKINEGNLSADTIVFNNMVDTVAGLQFQWEVPAKHSWHAKYFK